MSTYCPRCAVELEDSLERCPLCGEKATRDPGALPSTSRAYPGTSEEFGSPVDQILAWRGRVMLIVTLALAIPGVVCLLVDYLYTGLTWSYWVIYSLALVWGLIFIFMAFLRMPLFMLVGQIFSLAVFLWALDLTDKTMEWSLSLALPILLWIALAAFIIWLGAHWFSKLPGCLIASVLAGVLAICFGIDLNVRIWEGLGPGLSWSLVVLAALAPLSVMSVLIQIFLLKSVTFKRFFHW